MPLSKVNLGQDLTPLSWLVDGLILQGYINTIASLPGEGKTALLTGLAWQATRSDGEFLQRRVAHGVTLYVDFDAPGDGRTVRYWLDKHRQVFSDGDLDKIVVLEPDLDTYGLAVTELEQLTKVAKETKAKLILIDSFSSAFPSTDPIKLVQVQGPLWHLRRLAHETGAAVVIADHLPKPISGEKAGARGIIGSVAKSAQARAVHILSRVPLNNVQGRNVLRWDTTKMSYSSRPKPFGVELRFDKDTVSINVVGLPEGQGETRTERAIRAMQNHLETYRGSVITHQELFNIAMQEGNLRRRASIDAIQLLKERYGEELVTTFLPGRGKPQGYLLKLETHPPSLYSASLHQIGNDPSETANHSVHTLSDSPAPKARKTAPNSSNATSNTTHQQDEFSGDLNE